MDARALGLKILSCCVSFGVTYVAGRSIARSWMKKSRVADFENVLGIIVYALSPTHALITYETNVALWHDDVVYVYDWSSTRGSVGTAS
jgi:hypothetical protein